MIQTTNGFKPRGSEAGDRLALEGLPGAAGRPDGPVRADAVRVVIADDAVLLREGVARLLTEAGFEVLAQAGDADELVRKVRAYRPDVAIVDVRMPPTNSDDGLRAAVTLRDELPELGILLLSQYVEDRYLDQLMAGGADGVGYLLKERVAEVERLDEAVRRVAAGGSVLDPEVVAHMLGRRRDQGQLDALTERERAVLELIAEGRTNRAIGAVLYLSDRAVERRISSIFAKLDLPASDHDHRRILAALAYLRGSPAPRLEG
jgi:DNA-binding NarL/FixJ family response regulator